MSYTEGYAEHAHNQVIERARLVARRLREMADEVDRQVKRFEERPPVDLHDLGMDHSGLVSDVLHVVLWGLANLGLERFSDYGRHADVSTRVNPKEES